MNIIQNSESYYERTDARTDERTKEQAYASIQGFKTLFGTKPGCNEKKERNAQ